MVAPRRAFGVIGLGGGMAAAGARRPRPVERVWRRPAEAPVAVPQVNLTLAPHFTLLLRRAAEARLAATAPAGAPVTEPPRMAPAPVLRVLQRVLTAGAPLAAGAWGAGSVAAPEQAVSSAPYGKVVAAGGPALHAEPTGARRFARARPPAEIGEPKTSPRPATAPRLFSRPAPFAPTILPAAPTRPGARPAPARGLHVRPAASGVRGGADAGPGLPRQVPLQATPVRRHLTARAVAEATPRPGPKERSMAEPRPRPPAPAEPQRLPKPQPAREPAPAERRYRAAPPSPAPAAPPAAPRAAQQPPAPPQLDIAALDRQLWQRFEKRIRIEQERRGR